MNYNDEASPTLENFENMARAYSEKIKNEGFVFINLNDQDYSFLLEEVFDILFKLRASYRFLNGFLGSNLFLDLTEEQIKDLRDLFDYTKNRGFRVQTNNTKCFLNTVSLESKLILKLGDLAKKSDHFSAISSIINKRLVLIANNYQVDGIFNNLSNLGLK